MHRLKKTFKKKIGTLVEFDCATNEADAVRPHRIPIFPMPANDLIAPAVQSIKGARVVTEVGLPRKAFLAEIRHSKMCFRCKMRDRLR